MESPLRIRRSIPTLVVIAALAAGVLTATTPPMAAAAADFTAQTWRSVEIPLASTATYADPFSDVDVTATFSSPGAASIARPAFWDGSGVWKVRFAAPSAGTWTMTTSATNASDGGLNGVVKTIDVTAYSGTLEIFQRGFLTPSADNHYLTYRDGTPFLYLGDTHWILPHERWASSNAPGVPSQFKYTVDKRVTQGFTVYQSEPIWQPHGTHNPGADEQPVVTIADGIAASDLPGFANLDRKFAYIADAGLVHANAMISWVDQLNGASTAYAQKLARYWDARYGAYPVIWTLGQELDKNRYGSITSSGIAAWTAAIEALDAADAYDQPIMPHQEATEVTTASDSRYCPYPYTGCASWFDGFAAQTTMIDNWDQARLQTYWTSGRPTLAYETKYDKLDVVVTGYQLGTDSRHALSAFYKAYLSGMRGYGYGINGLWNDIYSKNGEPLDSGTDYGVTPSTQLWWYDAANDATAGKLQYGMTLFKSLEWWKLTPRFGDTTWSDFGSGGNKFLASDGNKVYVALFADATTGSGTLRGLSTSASYSANWLDPNTGVTTSIGTFTVPTGSWTAPAKPSTADFVLVVKKSSTTPATPACTKSVSSPTSVDLTDSAVSFSSSSARANQQPEFAFDNNPATNWQGANNNFPNEDLTVDFGRTVTVESVTISEYNHRTRGFRIEYFSGGTWAQAYAVPSGYAGFGNQSAPTTISFAPVTGTKVRILYLLGSEYSPVVYEMLVTGSSDLTIGATASSPQAPRAGQDPSKAIDKSIATNWQPVEGSLDGTSLVVDWGAQRTFNRVTVSEYGSRSQSYRLQTTSDGTTWTDICYGSGGFGADSSVTTLLTFDATTGKALRLLFDHVTAYSPIIYELKVLSR